MGASSSQPGVQRAITFQSLKKSPFQVSSDIFREISYYLDDKSMCRLSSVCRHFNKSASAPNLWQWRLAAAFPDYGGFGNALNRQPSLEQQHSIPLG